MHLQPGQVIADKYRIVRMIGHGGMGAVFEGENTRIRRRVAIKTLHAQVSGKADVLERFEREAQAAGRIGSEHIVEVLDMGDLQDGTRFMVMEFLEGMTLGDRIVKQGRIPPRELVGIMDGMLDGLGAAHAAGIIHRDLKPANIFLVRGRAQADFVKILDFGVSKFNVLNSEEMSMTRTGAVVGTPYYMSPEQAKGARTIDARSDLYSTGVILYEAITGQVPFNAQTFNELIFKIALESPPPPEQFVPTLDVGFSSIMRRAMAREPNERFQSAAELREALLAWAREYDAYGGVMPQGGVRGSSPHLMAGAGTMKTQMLPMVGMQGPSASVAKTAMLPASAFAPPPGAYPEQLAQQQQAPQHHAQQHQAQQHQAQQQQQPYIQPVQGYPHPQQAQQGYQQQYDKPPPLGTEAYAGPVPEPPKNRAPLFVGLAVLVLAIVGGGYFGYARAVASSATKQPDTAETAKQTGSDASSSSGSSDTPAPANTETAAPADTSTPTPEGSVSAAPEASTAPSGGVAQTPTGPTGRPTGTIPTATARPTGTATAGTTGTAKNPPSSTSSGRSIGSDL